LPSQDSDNESVANCDNGHNGEGHRGEGAEGPAKAVNETTDEVLTLQPVTEEEEEEKTYQDG